jgi:hypothetical protein
VDAEKQRQRSSSFRAHPLPYGLKKQVRIVLFQLYHSPMYQVLGLTTSRCNVVQRVINLGSMNR